MGPGRAGGDDDPVDPVVLEEPLHLVLGVLGTGKEVVVGEDDIGKPFCIFLNLGDVHDAADVYAAIADKDADPRFLSIDISLVRELLDDEIFSPRPGDERCRLAGRSAGGGHRFGDILGGFAGAACVDPFTRGEEGIFYTSLDKAVSVELYTQRSGKFAKVL